MAEDHQTFSKKLRAKLSRFTLRGKTLQHNRPSTSTLASRVSHAPSTSTEGSHGLTHQASYATGLSQLSNKKSVSSSLKTVYNYPIHSATAFRRESEDAGHPSAGHTPPASHHPNSRTPAATPGMELSELNWQVSAVTDPTPLPSTPPTPVLRATSSAPTHGILKPSSREAILCDSCKKDCKHGAQDDAPSSTSNSPRLKKRDDAEHHKKAQRKTSGVTFSAAVEEAPPVAASESEPPGAEARRVNPPPHPRSDVMFPDAFETAGRSESNKERALRLPKTRSDMLDMELPLESDKEHALKSPQSAPVLGASSELQAEVSPGTAPAVIPLSPIVTPELHSDGSSQDSAREKLRHVKERSKSRASNIKRSLLTKAEPAASVNRPLKSSFVSVAERIRTLESKNAATAQRGPSPSRPAKPATKEKSRTFEHPSLKGLESADVAPLRIKRSDDRSSHEPETPIHRSIPEDDPYIHSPQPERPIPSIIEPLESAHQALDTSRGDDDGFAISSGFGRRAAKNFAVRRTSYPHEDVATLPASHHRWRYQLGTITNCPRHGRRPPGTQHGTGATRDMVERSRSGEYVAIGMLHRSQLDATSPWAYLEKAKVPIEDVCPDCAAEERLFKQEAGIEPGDITAAPFSPLRLTPSMPERDAGVVTAMKLPQDTGTTVLHKILGLQELITNIHQGKPTAPIMQQLSEKLAKASQEALRSTRSSQSDGSSKDRLKTMVFDTQPIKQAPSIPELLQLTDQAASEMRLDIGQNKLPVKDSQRIREQSLLHSEDANGMLSGGSPTVLASGPYCLRPTPGPPSVYVTAIQSPKTILDDAPALMVSEAKRSAQRSPVALALGAPPAPAATPLQRAGQEYAAPEDHVPVSHETRSPYDVSPRSTMDPGQISPASIKSRSITDALRASNLWLAKRKSADNQGPIPAKSTEQTQLDLHRARLDKDRVVQEAAEIKGQMRRKVRAKGGLGGISVQRRGP